MRRSVLLVVWMVAGMVWGRARAAGSLSSALADAWASTEEARKRDGLVPSMLEDADFPRLAEGELVRHQRVSADGVVVGSGAMWLPFEVEAVWLSILDSDHGSVGGGMTTVTHLPGSSIQHRVNYTHMSLPWPLHDRQWVGEVVFNLALFRSTQGAVWERAWYLGSAALAPSPDPHADWIAANDGGWTLLPVGTGTLVVCGIRIDVGVSFFGETANRWAATRVTDVFRRLTERSADMPAHYDAQHVALIRPDGRPIIPGSLVAAR